ncbi:MAG TPA: peptidoglycan-associated lipoprotein Pal [Bryobacterales bacterium]|nr:peptidoglycan-associated lipoprotein Pal [Bryobacterales bacterium]
MGRKRELTLVLLGLCLVLFTAAGCKKKAPPPPPPPPPPKAEEAPPAPRLPTVSFSAEPSTIERGQSSTLRWSSTDATSASIDHGIGTVDTNGSREVSPADTTTYNISVRGPGGTARGSATVTVSAAAPPPPPPRVTTSAGEELSRRVQDAYFDFDKSDIRADARTTLTSDADGLKAVFNDFPNLRVVIEGHCDERGSAEYNLGLGDRRATAAKEFLTQLGVAADKLSVISYGKERPQCTEHTEECWQRNRRVHFTASQ